ncbi:MAG: hypothetical protein CMJ66_03145 [Planctomycetaceae bacterium]|nr:hypothetical protein [Planctomycetaceae bacterium]
MPSGTITEIFTGRTIHAHQLLLNHPQVLSHHDTNQKFLPTESCEIDVFVYPVLQEFPKLVTLQGNGLLEKLLLTLHLLPAILWS